MTNLLLYILALFIFLYLIYETYRDGGIWEAFKFTVIFATLFIGIRYFLVQPFLVDGPSMSPTYETGHYLLVEKLSYILGEPHRGDVVVFDEPEKGLELGGQKKICYISNFWYDENLNPDSWYGQKCLWQSSRYLIKRAIGLPGEKVVIINGATTIYNKENPNGILLDERYVVHADPRSVELSLGEDEYFVMGDNRQNSLDSRYFGIVKKELIVGRPLLRLVPLSLLGIYPGDHRDAFSK
jgi:signal peptidase I